MEASQIESAVAVRTPVRVRVGELRRSETASAAGLAIATIGQQLMAVLFTVVFTRILGTGGYGSLAALNNLTVILLVPGSALQVVAARHGTLGRLGRGGELTATMNRWTRRLVLGLAVVAVLSALLRVPLAALVNVDQEWAAAAVPVSAALWLLISVQRGLLQSARAYRPVGYSLVLEGVGRMAGGLMLVAAGLEVTGAFLGLLVAYVCIAAALHRSLHARLGAPEHTGRRHPLTHLVRHAAVPIAGLTLVAALQNVDVILARHALDPDTAGVYAATTVAAKFIVWVAVGIGLWVLPEATRRAAAGLDPRTVLMRALGLIGLLCVPALAAFAAFPETLLELAFGADYRSGAGVLLPLGVAFAFLACAFVAVQYLLALHRRSFVVALAVVAAAEPLLLLGASSLDTFAIRVLVVQAAGAAVAVGLALAVRHDPRAQGEPLL